MANTNIAPHCTAIVLSAKRDGCLISPGLSEPAPGCLAAFLPVYRPTAFVVGRGMDLETAVAVKDLALRMGNAAVYKEGGIAGEDYPNHLKLKDVDDVRIRACCEFVI